MKNLSGKFLRTTAVFLLLFAGIAFGMGKAYAKDVPVQLNIKAYNGLRIIAVYSRNDNAQINTWDPGHATWDISKENGRMQAGVQFYVLADYKKTDKITIKYFFRFYVDTTNNFCVNSIDTNGKTMSKAVNDEIDFKYPSVSITPDNVSININ